MESPVCAYGSDSVQRMVCLLRSMPQISAKLVTILDTPIDYEHQITTHDSVRGQSVVYHSQRKRASEMKIDLHYVNRSVQFNVI